MTDRKSNRIEWRAPGCLYNNKKMGDSRNSFRAGRRLIDEQIQWKRRLFVIPFSAI